jgi:FixJ family two-component response regulator
MLISVVDDEELIRRALVRVLHAAGYAANSFASGREFLQSWLIERPDCVVLDLKMPGLSGIEVQRALDEAGARLPVVIITAHDEPGAREECMRLGAVAYLRKPLNDFTLLDALKHAVGSPD